MKIKTNFLQSLEGMTDAFKERWNDAKSEMHENELRMNSFLKDINEHDADVLTEMGYIRSLQDDILSAHESILKTQLLIIDNLEYKNKAIAKLEQCKQHQETLEKDVNDLINELEEKTK